MESVGHRTGTGDREKHHCHHIGQQRNHHLVSEVVCGSAEGIED